MREKLIELLAKAEDEYLEVASIMPIREIKEFMAEMGCYGFYADHLIANGVTIATDNNKWIPVTERLPDLELAEAKADDFDLYACLATIKNNRARNGRYVGKVWWDGEIFINADCTDVTHEVTHWMPLPEPPKGE